MRTAGIEGGMVHTRFAAPEEVRVSSNKRLPQQQQFQKSLVSTHITRRSVCAGCYSSDDALWCGAKRNRKIFQFPAPPTRGDYTSRGSANSGRKYT